MVLRQNFDCRWRIGLGLSGQGGAGLDGGTGFGWGPGPGPARGVGRDACSYIKKFVGIG